jgi:UDP-N-acetylmuramate dehydrogenase
MFNLLHNVSLKKFNTFGIDVNAGFFLLIESEWDLINFFDQNKKFLNEKLLILGGGSNLLFLGNFQGIIINPQIKGIKIISENQDTVEVEVGAGEVWDDFVDFCVEKEWGGLENLSLIPGNVGAVPVQNIGAYGMEVKSSILKVNAVNLIDFSRRVFSNDECHFGYRNSIFKNELKDQYLISSVVFVLKKNYTLNLSYGALKTEIGENTAILNLTKVRQAVISVRKSKLPDPEIYGNAGSFFKNPIINSEASEKLLSQYPQIPIYPCEFGGFFKTSAAWLIEKSGWKGRSYKNAAVHDKQSLVLINKGGATGIEIFELSELIRKDVFSKFGINLHTEVNIISAK